jgi:hypothetical protein
VKKTTFAQDRLGEYIEVPAWRHEDVEGLVAARGTAEESKRKISEGGTLPWSIYHEGSGKRVCSGGGSRESALSRIAALGVGVNWTRSEEELLANNVHDVVYDVIYGKVPE